MPRNVPPSKRKAGKLTEGPVGKTLFTMALGLLGGHVAMVIFGSTDTYFISRLGTHELAAMAFCQPVMMLMLNSIFGLGIGTGAMVAKSAGSGDTQLARRYILHACVLNLSTASLMSVLAYNCKDYVFTYLGADAQTLPLVNEYLAPWLLGFPFFVIPMTINNSLRALGEVKLPMTIMSTAAFMNLILDPILIFGLGPVPALGLRGAAIATIGSRFFTLIAVLYIANKRLDIIKKGQLELHLFFQSCRALLRIGIPAMSSMLLMPLANNIIVGIMANNGTYAVAAFGAGRRIDIIAYLPIMALSNAQMAFFGQNLGAGKIDRIRKAHRLSVLFACLWGLAMGLIFLALREPIASLFAKDAQTFDYLVSYLFWAPLAFCASNVVLMSFSQLNGLHKPLYSTVMSVTRSALLMVVPAYLGQQLLQAKGIFISQTLGAYIGCIIAFFVVAQAIRSESKTTALADNKPE